MYLPEETCSLSDTAKIGQEKNKIKFKYLNFCSLPDNTCFILRRKNVHAGLAQVISYNISRYPNLNRIYDMPDKVFTEFGNLDGLRCGGNTNTMVVGGVLWSFISYKACIEGRIVLTALWSIAF